MPSTMCRCASRNTIAMGTMLSVVAAICSAYCGVPSKLVNSFSATGQRDQLRVARGEHQRLQVRVPAGQERESASVASAESGERQRDANEHAEARRVRRRDRRPPAPAAATGRTGASGTCAMTAGAPKTGSSTQRHLRADQPRLAHERVLRHDQDLVRQQQRREQERQHERSAGKAQTRQRVAGHRGHDGGADDVGQRRCTGCSGTGARTGSG